MSEASRHLLLVLGSWGDGIVVTDLQKAFDAFYVERGKQYGFETAPSDFKKALEELEGNFIRIERSSSQLIVSCSDPSILDFLEQRFSENEGEATDILRYAVFFEQVERLFQIFHADNTRKRQEEKHLLDQEVVEQAIARTLLAQSTRLMDTGQGAKKWRRSPIRIGERLQLCCRIGLLIRYK